MNERRARLEEARVMSEWRLTRRAAVTGVLSTLAIGCAGRRSEDEFAAQVRALETRIGGRVGVCALDTGDRRTLGCRQDERFAMCSTFKALLAGAVLARVEAGALALEQDVRFGAADMIAHAPLTAARLDVGRMTVRELCAASVEVSDNPAANLLLALIGGPAGLTRFLREQGDELTRLDRTEPALNENLPGDPRDTTTPQAVVRTLQKLLLEDSLSHASRMELAGWLRNARTGLQRIRAGLPVNWQAGDKTGTGAEGAANDVAIVWPPGRAPILIAVYLSGSREPLDALNQVHAQIGALVAKAFA